jgi:tetratricopeptide (TPR) repeat protein
MQRLCDRSPSDFNQRCVEKLKHLGDIAAEAHQHDEAITHYSTALSLNPVILQDIFIKRSMVYMAKGSWEEAIDDANQVRHSCLAQDQSCRRHYH